MTFQSSLRATVAVLLLTLGGHGGVLANTPYLKWSAVQAPVSSGASCGNGTPFHFFVNRSLFSRKTLVYFEGGGACWQQRECLGQGKFSEVATNPNGVPADYFSQLNLAAFGLVSPMITRFNPLNPSLTQSWNIVYVPYCTGDVHTGNAVGVYGDQTPSAPLTYYHRGHVNAQQVARWVAQHLPSDELLVSGFSAGSAGATSNYSTLRDAIRPKRSSLMADSGPLFPAPVGADVTQYPSLPLHNRIREAWGFERADGILTQMIVRHPRMNELRDDIGRINGVLAQIYPQDRFGYTVFQEDGVYSTFSYRLFNPDIAGLSSTAERDAAYNRLWRRDLKNWVDDLAQHPNVGYYIPTFRPLAKSHTLTTFNYSGTAIEERGLWSIEAFIRNTVDRQAAPIRAVEQDQVSDRFRLVDGVQWIIALFQDLFV